MALLKLCLSYDQNRFDSELWAWVDASEKLVYTNILIIFDVICFICLLNVHAALFDINWLRRDVLRPYYYY